MAIKLVKEEKTLQLGTPTIAGGSSIPGEPGKDGASAYEIAIKNGFEGSEQEWLKSLEGAPGQNGKDGAPGEPGYTPIKGIDYFDGEPGKDGVDGKDGSDGKDGKDGYTPIKGVDYFDGAPGKDGVDGKDGKDGAPGKDGKDGYTPVKGVDYFDGEKGEPGKDGKDGEKGEPGYTPVKGVDYFDGAPGKDGEPGQPGKDGYTPQKGIDYFDGEPGAPGKDGKDGVDGKDGYTPVKGVDYFDGVDGKDGKDGKDGAAGKDGRTPVRGIDYWTEEDVEAINTNSEDFIASELAKRGQVKPEFANSIDECTDTSKLYVLPDGYIYGCLKQTGPLFTNQIANAVDTDKTPYNGGLGYKTDKYIGASGAEGDASGYIATGYIPIKNIQNLVLKVSGYTGALTTNDQMKFYNSSFGNIALDNNDRLDSNVKNYGGTFVDEPAFNNTVKTFTFDYQVFKTKSGWYSSQLANGNPAYVRFSLKSPDVEKMVVTINEEIVFGTSYQWVSTGHAFVPADYEDRIIEVEKDVQKHEERIKTLETYGGGSSSPTSVDVPAYIKAEAEDVMTRLMEKQGNRVFNMVAMSDFHYSNYAAKYGGEEDDNRTTLISAAKATSYMLDRIHIDAVATLGDNTPFGAVTASDIEWGHKWHKEINTILNMTQRPGVVDFRTVGNHDRMGGKDTNGNLTPIMPDGAIYQYIQGYNRQCDYLSAPVGYGYKDFEGYKLRVIVLNSAECEGKGRFSEPHHGYFIGNNQYNWLINKALDMSSKENASEWQILILSHHRADDAQVATDGNSYQKNAFILPNILHAYKTGGSYSGVIAEEGISVQCNFAGKNQAKLIGQIHGHHHNYKYQQLYLGASSNSTQTTIMAVGTPTSSLVTNGNTDNNGNTYTGVKGTAEETAFCVYSIDLDNHKIYAIHYGNGVDREINY